MNYDETAKRYDRESMLARIQSDRSEVLIGFVPWADDCEQWPRTAIERYPDSPDGKITRTIWTDPERTDARVLVDSYECRSDIHAVDALIRVLAGNQLANMPAGPGDVGAVSFTQPEDLPPAVVFVRANLCVFVSSFGGESVPVLPWAERLDHRIVERPDAGGEIDVLGAAERNTSPVVIPYSLPFRLVDGGYLKVFSTGGTLTLTDAGLTARPAGDGSSIEVTAYVVEPGRPAQRSHRTYTTA